MTPPRPRSKPLIIAHRGFHRKVRENTREAILAAHDIGAHGVEFDVRTTADGAHVLHHNRTRLIRGRQRPISLLPRSLLPAWVPTLEAILRRMERWNGFLVDVELKDPHVHPDVLALLRTISRDRLIVTSFHRSVCKDIATRLPDVPVGWLRERPQARDASIARRVGCRMLIVHRRDLKPNIAKATKRHRVELWTWGINTVRRARAAVELGVRGIITDRPDLLLHADLTRPARPKTSPRKDHRGS